LLLSSCDLPRLQTPLRLFRRPEALLWYSLMLQHVKPQGEVLPGRPFSTWHATRARAVRARGDFRGPRALRRARSNPGPPGFFPFFGEEGRLKAGCSF